MSRASALCLVRERRALDSGMSAGAGRIPAPHAALPLTYLLLDLHSLLVFCFVSITPTHTHTKKKQGRRSH